mgnify:CR=1 FL=1
MSVKNFYDLILDLVYPPVCGICGKFNREFLCKKCQKVLEAEAKFQIDQVDNQEYFFENHLYIFKYEGIIRKLILNYKFNEKSFLYKTFVNFLIKNEKFFKILKSYDTIIPIPISSKRMNERGYNQSELIANELVKQITEISSKHDILSEFLTDQKDNIQKLKCECVTDCLIKAKNIIEQSKLNKEQRQKNIQGVYILKNNEKLINKKILLIDDIYTTGSTANECCKVLQKAKPKKIDVFTIAKD